MDIAKNIAWLNQQNTLEKKRIQKLRRKAFEALPGIVDFLLSEDPEISKIILFGSLTNKPYEKLHLGFDIDLAVHCSKDKYYHLVSSIQYITEFKIDLVDIDSLRPFFRQKVMETGIVLYEK